MTLNQCQLNYKMINKEIKIPNIGDFKDVEIIEVIIKNGQSIKKNDPLITIESDKSSIEIPSPYDGSVKSVNVKIGDKVSEGDKILTLELNEKIEKNDQSKENSEKKREIDIESKKQVKKINIEKKTFEIISASPKTRKFARELGIDINEVEGSERQGRVLEEDIKQFVSLKVNEIKDENIKKENKINDEFSHSEFGEVEIQKIPRVKKLASTYLSKSWSTIPHVTNHDEADITEMEEFRDSLKDMYTGEKKKITPLAFIIKALAASLKEFPIFNCSIDDIENGKMTLKKYFHIGIAVDTPHGLMVPKIRNANNKNISHISNELKEISDSCRNLKIDKKELFGGSMTITSLGSIGGSFFTPIINYPEVAIIGVGRSEKKTKND